MRSIKTIFMRGNAGSWGASAPIAIALAAMLASAGCTSPARRAEPAAVPAPAPGAAELAGSSWRLVAFQSMDDSQGTTKPGEGRDYTLDFGSDGMIAMQLDCNRGRATWRAVPGAEGRSGQLAIGPGMTTRAFCPQPDIGPMLAARLADVTSYTLKEGHLFLALKMDGGIFEFAPR
ncbi:META domain-containing protein [Novosphingobium clariflavum]|uniref:META domain-containing protein n=1 Tax=Novosphingobium clariflavum TaxID=2029884 RepID=A0ABV6SG98_9SPHN|nr:META domain-containing protein [Novosphingobium clariflavum]